MMATIQSCVRKGKGLIRKWAVDPAAYALIETVGCSVVGCLLSGAGLLRIPLPLTLGLLLAMSGWKAVMVALGGCVGYLLFWRDAGLQGLAWMVMGVGVVLPLSRRVWVKQMPLLMPAIGGFIVAAGGVLFQFFLDDGTPILPYLMRVALGMGSTRVFVLVEAKREPPAQWLAQGMGVLALAQIAPVPWLGCGYLAAGFAVLRGAFPTAALSGLALDLAGITQVPMTAVMCMAYLVRLIPGIPRWICGAAAVGAAAIMMGISGVWDPGVLPGLAIGSFLGVWVPSVPDGIRTRRGETGMAQVSLELAAGVMSQSEQLLLETEEEPLDTEGLIRKAAERACGSCPCRKECGQIQDVESLDGKLLQKPLMDLSDLPIHCRKTGRILLELRRSQEQYRVLRACREQVRECRWAVIQQYQFLALYLQELSDRLSRKHQKLRLLYQPRIGGYTAGREEMDGDRCSWFSGAEGKYYVVLCDGMGTGLAAAQESRDAMAMLQRLLRAGYPAEYALRNVNSLCALRGKAGAVTVDLAELYLDSGKVMLYKWGAAPSYLVGANATEKIGTAGPPPGLSVTQGREITERLSLRRGETLILLSDGVDGEVIHRRGWEVADLTPEEAAARVLKIGRGKSGDDATAIIVRLVSEAVST